jgi:hypothetical protein
MEFAPVSVDFSHSPFSGVRPSMLRPREPLVSERLAQSAQAAASEMDGRFITL